MIWNVLIILIGGLSIIFALIAERFTSGFVASVGRPIPKLLGRLIFVAVGLWFIFWGFYRLHVLHGMK
jgi:hypothetical protein